VSRLHDSPLGPELDEARESGTFEVVAHATRPRRRRRRPVLATRLVRSEREQRFREAVAEMFTDWDMEVDGG